MAKILILGSGRDVYREHLLASVSVEHDVVLAQAAVATWQSRHVTSLHRITPGDLPAVLQLARDESVDAVLTWTDSWIQTAAAASSALRLPGHPVPSARACRDKHRMRQVWAAAGVPSARSVLVTEETQACQAAAGIGYPVVVKPRVGAGGAGVSLARDPAELARAYAAAAAVGHREHALAGVLVEEYLDGPQFSVEAVLVRSGRFHPVAVGTRRTGLPGFAAASRLVSGAHQVEQLASVRRAVEAAHAALGLCEGATHAEVRLTERGPRMVGLNARLGGDLISRLVPLATGIDLGAAAVDAALGDQPRLTHTRRRSAGIVFRYPDTAGEAPRPGLPLPDGVEAVWTAPEAAGTGGRLGHAIVVADCDATCQDRLDQAYAALTPAPVGNALAVA